MIWVRHRVMSLASSSRLALMAVRLPFHRSILYRSLRSGPFSGDGSVCAWYVLPSQLPPSNPSFTRNFLSFSLSLKQHRKLQSILRMPIMQQQHHAQLVNLQRPKRLRDERGPADGHADAV